MRRIHRAVVLVALLALGPLMTGCADFDMDKLDVFNLNQKKKLPGERKDLFPGGVPGVTQGIPPEYLRENQVQPQAAMTPGEGATAETQAAVGQPMQTAPQPVQAEKPKAKPKPKPRTASRPTRVNVGGAPTQAAPAQQSQQGASEPQPQQQPGQSPWPASNQSSSSAPWPSSPAPGTFSR